MVVRTKARRRPAAAPPPAEGGGGWGTPPSLGRKWFFSGDSQEDGRAATGTTHSSWEAFLAIYNASNLGGVGTPILDSEVYTKADIGVSGSGWSLQQSLDHYNSRSERLDRTFSSWMESGNQNLPGQATAPAYGDTFDTTRNTVATLTAAAVFIMQTAFSFGREATQYRNWDGHNTVLRERIAAHNTAGRTTYLAEVDRNIKDLQASLVSESVTSDEAKALVWYPASDTARAYHFTELGNLMVALSMFEALNINPATLNLSTITAVSSEHKAACLAVIAAYH